MKLGFFSKLQILLDSRKIFKNWYIYPKVYWQLTNDKIVVFETKTGLKIKIRVKYYNLIKSKLPVHLGVNIPVFEDFS
jgi:hypothetical protein